MTKVLRHGELFSFSSDALNSLHDVYSYTHREAKDRSQE